jgi:hypothetical protein
VLGENGKVIVQFEKGAKYQSATIDPVHLTETCKTAGGQDVTVRYEKYGWPLEFMRVAEVNNGSGSYKPVYGILPGFRDQIQRLVGPDGKTLYERGVNAADITFDPETKGFKVKTDDGKEVKIDPVPEEKKPGRDPGPDGPRPPKGDADPDRAPGGDAALPPGVAAWREWQKRCYTVVGAGPLGPNRMGALLGDGSTVETAINPRDGSFTTVTTDAVNGSHIRYRGDATGLTQVEYGRGNRWVMTQMQPGGGEVWTNQNGQQIHAMTRGVLNGQPLGVDDKGALHFGYGLPNGRGGFDYVNLVCLRNGALVSEDQYQSLQANGTYTPVWV